jgi:adenylate cyclase
MIPVAYQLSNLFSELSLKREEDINKEQTLSKSSEIVSKLQDILDKSFVIGSLVYREAEILKNRRLKAVNKEAINFNLERLRDIYRVSVYKKDYKGNTKLVSQIFNKDVLIKYKIPLNYHEIVDQEKPFPFLIPFNDTMSVRNRTIDTKNPLLSIGSPLVKEKGKVTHIVVSDFAFTAIQKTLTTQGYRAMHIVDDDGETIAHSDDKIALDSSSYNTGSRREQILKVIESKVHAGQFYYQTIEGSTKKSGYYSAYAKTPFGLTVFSETDESVIKEPAELAAKQVIYITSTVLFASLIIIYLFSTQITKPIALLSRLMFTIGEGKFNVRAKQVIRSNDEVGDLAHWFDHMVDGLKERDRVKQLFAKFQGTQIAEDLLREDFSNNTIGNTRKAVVFFSDIRGFTSYSEGKEPQEVVNMLNEYFTVMVNIISSNYGVVDKFIGDAIMAVWGAPRSTNKDAYYAIRACLEMKKALIALNEKRSERGENIIKIGMGLHHGDVVAGVLGSNDRMEYTVIGDTVNVASRIETATKEYGVDLLVSQSVYEQVKDDFEFKEVGETTLKGKENKTTLYTVDA